MEHYRISATEYNYCPTRKEGSLLCAFKFAKDLWHESYLMYTVWVYFFIFNGDYNGLDMFQIPRNHLNDTPYVCTSHMLTHLSCLHYWNNSLIYAFSDLHFGKELLKL